MIAMSVVAGLSTISAMVERAAKMIVDLLGKNVNLEKEIIELQDRFYLIQVFIQDVEEMQIEDIDIRAWLRQLGDIGYEARDVLDDFLTYERAKKASNLVKFNFLKSGLDSDIKSVNMKLDKLIKEGVRMVQSLFSSSETVRKPQRPETGPSQDKQRDVFVGRERIKEDIMRKVLNHNHNGVDIIPVWGMGGIGKTTLAQSIFNDPRVTESNMYPSKNRVWHCVGEKKLNAKEIITSFVDGVNSTSSVAEIQRRLVEKFKGDKFIIVLDDVWDVYRSEWQLLFDPLTCVGKGGVIIMVTRNANCIIATNSPVPDPIKFLSDDDCWEIFKRHAYNNTDPDNDRNQKLEIGRQIVTKLIKGLPLAAEVVGSYLFCERDVRSWRMVADYDGSEWLLMKVMDALRLSYNRLPSHLKRCFSYCALFPKDHVFDQTILVQMWMAHDIIPKEAKGEEQPEDIGAQYFSELVNASFFQCINGKYVMNHMIHNLALLVSKKVFITVSKDFSPGQLDEYVRHVSIVDDENYLKNLLLCKSKRILTVYTQQRDFWKCSTVPLDNGFDVLLDVFKQMKSTRVLVLSGDSITEIPDCIKELKHLRYLDVRGTKVKTLPDSLCELYHLQTLAADKDVVLPKDVGNLVNLKILRGATLPTYKGIANLGSLQEVSRVHVCKDGNISELRDLLKLRGKLEISGLGNVMSSTDAFLARMPGKLHIRQLSLHFSYNGKDCGNSKDVLQALNCPPNLEYLEICYYKGDKFPSWLANGASISSLQIWCCDGLKFLELNATVSLKHLTVGFCHKLERIRLSKHVAAAIEDMTIYDCPKLMEMEVESLLPLLRKLWLSNCQKLSSFPPPLFKIERLDVNDCEKLSSLSFNLEGTKSLKECRISECPMLKYFCMVEEESTSTSSSSTPTKVELPLPPVEDDTLYSFKFEYDTQERPVLKRLPSAEILGLFDVSWRPYFFILEDGCT